MKKIIASIFIAGLITAVLIGCAKKDASGTQAAAKAASKKLVVYSPAPEKLLNMIIQEFQDKTGIKIELVQAGSGELLTRIKSESANPFADIMFAGGAESMEAFKEFFAVYKSPETAHINTEYISSENLWTGVFVSPTVIMYNKNLVSAADAPKGWATFADAKWKGHLAFADPASSGSAYTTLSILLASMDKGDGGWNFIRTYIKALDGNILSSSSAPHKGVSDGEYYMCITPEESVLQYLRAGAQHIGIIYPEEGTGAVPSSVAVVKNAPNMENAKLFVDFVLGKEVQTKIPEHLYRHVRTDLPASGDFKPLSEILMKNYDFLAASKNKTANIKQWTDIVVGK
ncbi:ABC transporter substrate-binding protein [Treponema sp. HNW]|uniref:ABC transporter substrate-binding protein n=1 Tax=Treponema sp. HNW TaxID=3116654 RepID=UPI003D13C934